MPAPGKDHDQEVGAFADRSVNVIGVPAGEISGTPEKSATGATGAPVTSM